MYEWDNGRFDIAHRCLILWTKGTLTRDRRIAPLTAGYPNGSETPEDGAGEISGTEATGKASDNPLQSKLAHYDKEDTPRPAILAVFDLELSAQRTAARLVPRFISMDHSARDKKRDTRPRTIAFQFVYSVPGAGTSFGAPLVKVDNLIPGTAFGSKQLAGVTSTWFALPEIPASAIANREALRDATIQTEAELESALTPAAVAAELGDVDAARYLARADSRPIPHLCPASLRNNELLVERSVALALARLEPDTKETRTKIASLDNAKRFFDSCKKYHEADAIRRQFEFPFNGMASTYVARPFDLEVMVTEFRKRPFIEFWSSVLGNEATQASLATAIASRVDPATRTATQTTAEAEVSKALEAFETALVAAETAIAAYEATIDQQAKPAALINMEAKKRKANRLAQQLSRLLPYPDSGLWIP